MQIQKNPSSFLVQRLEIKKVVCIFNISNTALRFSEHCCNQVGVTLIKHTGLPAKQDNAGLTIKSQTSSPSDPEHNRLKSLDLIIEFNLRHNSNYEYDNVMNPFILANKV